MTSISRTVAVLLLLLGMSGCDDGLGTPAPQVPLPPTSPSPGSIVESVDVSPSTLTLLVGATGTVTATPRNASGAALSGKVITWSSATPSVATVSDGLVTAVGAGSTTINIVCDGKVAQVPVTVTTVPVNTLIVLPATATIEVGLTRAFTATAIDANNLPLAGRVVTWSSANPATASVNAGVVTAVGAGTTLITATSEGKSSSVMVTVVLSPTLADGLVVGPNTNCFARNGTRACWGRGVDGQFGNGTMTSLGTAMPIVHNPAMAVLSLGTSNSCGLTFSGFPFCWGRGAFGANGDGATTEDRSSPTVVNTSRAFTTINAAFFNEFACGLEADGTVWCWGRNTYGALGDGTNIDRLSPVKVVGLPPVVEIDLGSFFACARTAAGEIWCWGRNVSGELGRGAPNNDRVPQPVSGNHVFTALTVGATTACGLKADGSAWCWGQALEGQIGDGFALSRNVPTATVGAHAFVQLSLGRDFTCGRTAAGAVWCWGGGNNGELGTGTTSSSNTPVAVSSGLVFSDLQSGALHSCARSGVQIWCWGGNLNNQLGIGTAAAYSTLPVQVVGTP